MLIDWFTVAAQAVNFLILVWLLKRFLYQPVLAAIDEREKRISIQLQDAEKKKAQALQEQTDFLHKNEEFEQQRSALLLEATTTAKTEREKLLEMARRDSEELRSKLKKSLADELDNLNQKIETLAVQEVFSVVRKTLADLADVNLEERMTNTFIRRLHEQNDRPIEELKASLQSAPKRVLVRSASALPLPQKTAIEGTVKELFGQGTGIDFETKADLISGIELTANGQKIAWSIGDYLKSLISSVDRLLQPKVDPTPDPQKATPHAA
ncbi:MAG: F-type H+-transporting ATPase subunit b [Verrucomicrobiota bacterium]|nr:F-type H+-transporting ATPase subunit b [Verrucomicrobiota bacterium]